MERYAILSHNFRFLSSDGRGLALNRLSLLENLEQVLCLAPRGEYYSIATIPPQNWWYDFETSSLRRSVPMGNIVAESHKTKEGLFRLWCGEEYLVTINKGQNDALTIYSIIPEGQEGEECYAEMRHKNDVENDAENSEEAGYFRLVPLDVLDHLWHLARNRWVIGPDASLAGLEERESSFEQVRFGGLTVPYHELVASLQQKTAREEFFFLSDAELYRAVRFNPAILYVVFGPNVMRQFTASLEGLLDPGQYKGKIFVATDAPEDMIMTRCVPEELAGQISFIKMRASDYADYISARQTIFSSGCLDNYAPVIYTDGDVAVNIEIEPLLCRAVLERRISAQLEFFNDDFRFSESNGAELYRQDSYPILSRESGFNTGVLLVPNVRRHRPYLDPTFNTNIIYTNNFGRRSIPFHEQTVMNYALRKIGDFDASLINDVTETGGNEDHPAVIYYGRMEPSRAKGFVHFWATSEARERQMRRYLQRLRDYRWNLNRQAAKKNDEEQQ